LAEDSRPCSVASCSPERSCPTCSGRLPSGWPSRRSFTGRRGALAVPPRFRLRRGRTGDTLPGVSQRLSLAGTGRRDIAGRRCCAWERHSRSSRRTSAPLRRRLRVPGDSRCSRAGWAAAVGRLRTSADPLRAGRPAPSSSRTSGTNVHSEGVPLDSTPPARPFGLVRPPPPRFSPGDTVYSRCRSPRQRPGVGVLEPSCSGSDLAVDDRFHHRRGFWDVVDRCGRDRPQCGPGILAILAEEPPPAPAAAPIRFCPLRLGAVAARYIAPVRECCGIGVLRDLRYDRGHPGRSLCQPRMAPGARRPGFPRPPVGLDLRVWMNDGTVGCRRAAGLVEISARPCWATTPLVPAPRRIALPGPLRPGVVAHRRRRPPPTTQAPCTSLASARRGDHPRRGEVYPRVVEEVLSQATPCLDVAVVRGARPRAGRSPRAFVVPGLGPPPTCADPLVRSRTWSSPPPRPSRDPLNNRQPPLAQSPPARSRRDALRALAAPLVTRGGAPATVARVSGARITCPARLPISTPSTVSGWR